MKSTDLLNKDIKQLIINFLSGKTTHDEEIELQRRINENSENAGLFAAYRDVWLSSTLNVNESLYNKENTWQRISESIETGTKAPDKIRNRIFEKHMIQRILKIAALIVFVFLAGGICSLLVFRNYTIVPGKISVVTAPLGSKTFLILPDKSQVWLNAGSTLTYPEAFDKKNRRVKLQGEAFFKVKSNKSKPFIVSTGQIDIKALGTSFNVKAYPEENYITTTLVEGSVHINGTVNKRKFAYILKPNQNLTIPVIIKEPEITTEDISGTKKKQPASDEIRRIEAITSVINTEAIVSWKDQRWTIQGEPLNSLAVMLGRRYNTKIHMSSALLHEYKFSGIIQKETLEQVLQYLRYTTPLKYEIGKGEVWWDIDPELAKQYSKILDKNEE